jgi:hypothetical protein
MDGYTTKEYITMPLITISESVSISDLVKNGEMYELIEQWKEHSKRTNELYTYTISLEDLKELNSYIDDFVDSEIIYTYDHKEQIYIFNFYGELIGIITYEAMMNKEMKNITKMLNNF